MISMMIYKRRTKMRTNIRWPKIGLFLLTLLFLSAIPLTAEALNVQFCRPDCATALAANKKTVSETGTPVQNPTGVFTTTLNLTATGLAGGAVLNVGGFTVTGTPRAVAQQSGTLQKITFTAGTKITPPTSGCTPAAPCSIEIIATTDANDFPKPKPTGGYPAAVFLSGVFAGTQPSTGTNYPSPGPQSAGDSISMTAEASGLATDLVTPLNSDVINNTGGAGAGDIAKSLPSQCTGQSGCKFAATSLTKSFNSSVQETVQQKCAGTATSCRTRLKMALNISFKANGPGNAVTLPSGALTVDPPDPAEPDRNPVAELIAQSVPPFENLTVNAVRVFSSIKTFELDAGFTLDDGNSIDPAKEETYLRVGSFTMTILADKFKRFLVKGRLVFTFLGKVDGLNVGATFLQRADPSKWTFVIFVNGINLTPLLPPTGEVPVDLVVGGDTGFDLVAACFSKGCFSPRP